MENEMSEIKCCRELVNFCMDNGILSDIRNVPFMYHDTDEALDSGYHKEIEIDGETRRVPCFSFSAGDNEKGLALLEFLAQQKWVYKISIYECKGLVEPVVTIYGNGSENKEDDNFFTKLHSFLNANKDCQHVKYNRGMFHDIVGSMPRDVKSATYFCENKQLILENWDKLGKNYAKNELNGLDEIGGYLSNGKSKYISQTSNISQTPTMEEFRVEEIQRLNEDRKSAKRDTGATLEMDIEEIRAMCDNSNRGLSRIKHAGRRLLKRVKEILFGKDPALSDDEIYRN